MRRFWLMGLLGGISAIAGVLLWRYGHQSVTTLLALNTETGTLDWVKPITSKGFYSRGPVASEGQVLLNFCTSSGSLNCAHAVLQSLDAKSGRVQWTNVLNPTEDAYEIVSNPSLIWQHHQIYLQVGSQLRSLDPASGQQRWAIQRPWFTRQGTRSGLGLVTRVEGVTMIEIQNRQRILKSLNPKTGEVLHQFTLSVPPLNATADLIAASDSTLILEQSQLTPSESGGFQNTGQSTLTAYDLKTGAFQFNQSIRGPVEQMQMTQNRLFVSTFDQSLFSLNVPSITQPGQLLVLDGKTGQVQWQRSKQAFSCLSDQPLAVKAESIILTCAQKQGNGESTQVLALATATGQLQWKVQTHPNNYSKFLPLSRTNYAVVTFRKQSANLDFTQILGLNPQDGRLLWIFSLYDDQFINRFRSTVATDGNHLFVLDRLPRWQIGLLHWHLGGWRRQAPPS